MSSLLFSAKPEVEIRHQCFGLFFTFCNCFALVKVTIEVVFVRMKNSLSFSLSIQLVAEVGGIFSLPVG